MADTSARAREAGVVGGVFRDEGAVQSAVLRLEDAHFDAVRDVQVVNAHRREHEAVPVTERFQIARNGACGAALGALAGLVLAGMVVFEVMDDPLGLLSSAPLVALFQGAFLLAVAGFAFGVVSGIDCLHDEVHPEDARVHGVTWVGVRATGSRAEEARRILRQAGARHLTG